MNVDECALTVRNRAEFVAFLQKLCVDLEENRGAWENDDLLSFLEAMLGWCQDLDGLCANTGYAVDSRNRWQLMADLLMAARIYE